MINVAFIPIDNRPVSYSLPKQISELNDQINLILPPRHFLGDLNSPANVTEIFNWLKHIDFEYAIVSLDTIAYSGLIQSRQSTETFDDVKSKIDEFFAITYLKKAKIYAFSSIMRISNNNINEEEKYYWDRFGKRIFDYSFYSHKYEIEKDEPSKLKTEKFKSLIDKEILEDYLLTRKRNFDLNKYYLELFKAGLIETLVYSKDDCAQFGFNVKEACDLSALSDDEKNIFIKTGADEIPIVLLNRLFMKNKKLSVNVSYNQPKSINLISKYEDTSVEDSIKKQLELSGLKFTTKKNAKLTMYVNNFKNEQGELVMGVFEPENSKVVLPKNNFFIADILNANGADNRFVKKLLPKLKRNKNFLGYSAWNTTSNSLGSAIAVACFAYYSNPVQSAEFKKLQILRFLDDWAYQAIVRQVLKTKSDVPDKELIKNLMVRYENILQETFGYACDNITYSFPWDRYFEVEVNI